MRIVVGLLACAGALGTALANPPPAPAAASAAAATASSSPASARSAAPAARPTVADAQSGLDQREKQLISQGYRIEMHGGQKLFCRHESQLGSHLPGPKVCQTEESIKAAEQEAQEATQRMQRFGAASGK